MFYLTIHSIHIIGHKLEDHSNRERGNLLPPPHGLLFVISSKGSFICTSHRQESIHHYICYISCRALAGSRNSSMSGCSTTELHLTPQLAVITSGVQVVQYNYTLLHKIFSTFFSNNISFLERRNKRKSVLEITKMYYFKI